MREREKEREKRGRERKRRERKRREGERREGERKKERREKRERERERRKIVMTRRGKSGNKEEDIRDACINKTDRTTLDFGITFTRLLKHQVVF